MSLCKHCNKEFIIAPSRRSKIKECKRTVCNSCTVSKRRWKSKLELIAKLGGKCQRCGFVGHPGSYHFHHKDPSKKLFEINANKLLTKDRISEINKCELLCANCHCVEHSNNNLIKSFGLI